MPARTIPLVDQRLLRAEPSGLPAAPLALDGALRDALGRPLRDLRISVTDRCNFRCSYCMPRERFKGHRFLPHAQVLSFEEITRTARLFMQLGVRKLRLTGGEPLLRRDLDRLVAMLAALRTPDGQPADLTLTTNGSALAEHAQALKAAGLKRVTVSLDALDDAVFRRMNDADWPVADVLAGIEAAQAAGLGPIKVNMVVQRGVNDGQILPMARHFRGSGVELRFIEYMDVGSTNGWRLDQVLPSAQVLQRLQELGDLLPVSPTVEGETAERWRWADGSGHVGLISSVSRAFCGDCNRARLATDGRVFLCLFAREGADLRALLRSGAGDTTLLQAIGGLWSGRADRYSELRGQSHAASAEPRAGRVEMSFIGG
ncbi:MAG: GTP 3',8-cyclase MoaA [Aquabacterium sp.]|nr:GTP 3',8-cyclase MoaA [Aquabacterium sp.]